MDKDGWNDEVGLMVMDELLDVLIDGSGGGGRVKEAPNGAKELSKSNPCGCDCGFTGGCDCCCTSDCCCGCCC